MTTERDTWPVPGPESYFERVFERALLLGLPVSFAQYVMENLHPNGFIFEALCIATAITTGTLVLILGGAVIRGTWQMWK